MIEFLSAAAQRPQDEICTGTGWSAEVLTADDAALKAYETFAQNAVFVPPQHPLWTRSWLEGKEGLIAVLSAGSAPVMALALEIVQKNGFRLARFPGGTHANGNFPALKPDALAERNQYRSALRTLLSEIRKNRSDVDLLALERMRTDFAGSANPLTALPHARSPNVSLAADLSSGLEGLLEGPSGKRRRKKHRSQHRKLQAAGGHRRFTASSPSQVDQLLNLFFALKRKRLMRCGLPDIFGDPHTQSSFRRLFLGALEELHPPFVLHALEVGGKVRALTGSSRTSNSIICEFSTFAQDELASASPGDFLFYQNIAEACNEGLAVYDFSVGDEPYKRAWCAIETHHVDVYAGLTCKGRFLAATYFAATAIKRTVKQNPWLAPLAARLRNYCSPSNQAASRPGGAAGGT
ncbi:GNAT family N-acetyltransferase [Chelativorans sp. Marseille-P2723]|uniref:GNAT family N-acetyltransferase n=1 Tax=Chelativorans sp. Marseille-P2723 TaxID=2709133 RepID=UPI00156DC25A|nr:GNAT family N-acetyltransferase [Chelativorans sp. Marseille-P2723]